MNKVFLSLCLGGLLVGAGGVGRAEGLYKNLQVLPKDITKDALKAIMKKQAKALGVDCDHCHDPPNMAEDTEHKKIGREMMLMTEEINKKYITTGNQKVTCMTCHRGKEKPEM